MKHATLIWCFAVGAAFTIGCLTVQWQRLEATREERTLSYVLTHAKCVFYPIQDDTSETKP